MDRTSLDLKKLNGSLGKWSFLCLVVSVFVLSFLTGFKPLEYFSDLRWVVSSAYSPEIQYSVFEVLKIVLHGTSILLAFGLTSGFIVRSVIGKDNLKLNFDPLTLFGSGPMALYLTVLFEEFLFRQVFLGWLRDLFGGGVAVTLILFLIGTAIFGLLHIFNHKQGHRSLFRLLPQFVLGILLAFLFLKYGFWITLIIHLTYDIVVFSSVKTQTSVVEDILSGIYWLVLGIALFLILGSAGIGLDSLSPWLTTTSLTALSLTPWQMIAVLVFASSVFGFVANLFVLDEPSADLEVFKKHGSAMAILSFGITSVVYVCVILGFSWILGLFQIDPFVRAMIIVLASLFIASPKSGSAVANLWFTGSPFTFLYVFVVLTFGFADAVLIIFISLLANYIPILINAYLGDLTK